MFSGLVVQYAFKTYMTGEKTGIATIDCLWLMLNCATVGYAFFYSCKL